MLVFFSKTCKIKVTAARLSKSQHSFLQAFLSIFFCNTCTGTDAVDFIIHQDRHTANAFSYLCRGRLEKAMYGSWRGTPGRVCNVSRPVPLCPPSTGLGGLAWMPFARDLYLRSATIGGKLNGVLICSALNSMANPMLGNVFKVAWPYDSPTKITSPAYWVHCNTFSESAS